MSDPHAIAPAPFRCPDALRSCYLDAHHAAGKQTSLDATPEVDAAIVECARDARAQHVTPERFLIAIKECLTPDFVAQGISPAQRELRRRTVTAALDAYYGSSGRGPAW